MWTQNANFVQWVQTVRKNFPKRGKNNNLALPQTSHARLACPLRVMNGVSAQQRDTRTIILHQQLWSFKVSWTSLTKIMQGIQMRRLAPPVCSVGKKNAGAWLEMGGGGGGERGRGLTSDGDWRGRHLHRDGRPKGRWGRGIAGELGPEIRRTVQPLKFFECASSPGVGWECIHGVWSPWRLTLFPIKKVKYHSLFSDKSSKKISRHLAKVGLLPVTKKRRKVKEEIGHNLWWGKKSLTR